MTRPRDNSFPLIFAPMIELYPGGQELKKELTAKILNELIPEAESGADLLVMLDRELSEYKMGFFPLKSVFLDSSDGMPVDPMLVDRPMLVIYHNDGTENYFNAPKLLN